MAEDILLFLLKGKTELTEPGWSKFLEVLIPVLPLVQCLANPASSLGKCIIKMLDPDFSSNINIPFIEVTILCIRKQFFNFFIVDLKHDYSLCSTFLLQYLNLRFNNFILIRIDYNFTGCKR
jgi:hypothetical protein